MFVCGGGGCWCRDDGGCRGGFGSVGVGGGDNVGVGCRWLCQQCWGFVVMLGFVVAVVVVVVLTSVVLESAMVLVVLVLVVVVAVLMVVRSACIFRVGDIGRDAGFVRDCIPMRRAPLRRFFSFGFLSSRENPECVYCTHGKPRGAKPRASDHHISRHAVRKGKNHLVVDMNTQTIFAIPDSAVLH